MPIIDINTFTKSANNNIGTGATFSHNVSRGTLSDSKKTWICKEATSPDVARIEILAQEFFRVMIPYQPETRIAHNPRTKTYYILSEEVDGYRDLPIGERENFSNGTYTGLGQVVACSMFLQEIDLKNGNLGLDKHGRVTKIDGDWCFAEERWEERWLGHYKITPNTISKLPYPEDYPVFNWLDLVVQGIKQPTSTIVNPNLAHALLFRAEVNQCLLNICLMPDSFIDHFVDAYIPAGGQQFIDLIKARRNQLTLSALQNQSFKTYLTTAQAEKDAICFFRNMVSFQYEKQLIIPSMHHTVLEEQFKQLMTGLNLSPVQLETLLTLDKIEKDIDDLVENLEQTTPNVDLVIEQLTKDTTLLLNEIRKEVNHKDILLKSFIEKSEQEISDNQNNPEKLQQINNNLRNILTSITSPEVVAIKNTIDSFRKKAGFFTIGMREKASKIEQAFYETPLEKRGTIISSRETNDVQKTLAQHRHVWRQSAIDTSNHIKLKQAAQTFKDLKAKFKELSDSDSDVKNLDERKTFNI